MLKNILCFFFMVLFVPALCKEPYVINTGDYQKITSHHMEYVEGLDSNVAIDGLVSATWSKELKSKQAYIDGFWMKVSLVNKSDQPLFFLWDVDVVLFSATKTKLHILKEGNLIHSDEWFFGDTFVDVNRWLSNYKVTLFYGDQYTLYYYIQTESYAHRQKSMEIISIMNWKFVYDYLIFELLMMWAQIVVLFVFTVYYFMIFLGSKEKMYLWFSLLLLTICIQTTFLSQMGNFVPFWFVNSHFICLNLVLCNIFFALLSISFLNIKVHFKKIHQFFVMYIGMMSVIFAGFFIAVIRWPLNMNLNLIDHPPNSILLLYERILLLSTLIIGFLSCYVAFKLWRKGNKAAGKYLLSFSLVPFIPLIMVFGRLIMSGFVINISIQTLFFLTLILFGLAIAQRMNDLKDETLKQQMLLTESYQRFVPEQLLTNLEKESILDVHLGDQVEKEMTVLFSDIRSFTTISESMTPKENFKFINSYLEMMGPLVRKNNGYIDKYMGDAIMALFDQDPNQAVATAVDMLNVLSRYNQEQNRYGDDRIRIGIGINTGRLILGMVGESNRMEGSVISDTVNVAARLEGLTKVYKTPLLISEGTKTALNSEQFSIRQIDQVAVKGKREAIMIYEVLDGEALDVKEGKLSTIDMFNQGIKYYQNKQFKKAKVEFKACKKQFKQDAVVQVYINRCDQLMDGHIDLSNWDGVNRLDVK